MIDRYSLIHEILKLAQYVARDEQLSAFDAQQSVRDTVARIAASPSTSQLQLALIAVHLAERIDASEALERA